MEVVYYFANDLNLCPVKKYLELKGVSSDRRLRILAEIDQKIEYVRQNDGRPTPPISEPLRDYSFFEIKNRKDKNIVIRVLYFRYKNQIVLLNAFEKPDSYSTNKDRKIIEKYYQLTDNYYNQFKINPKSYEKYQ
jgi:hypothetical protein